MEGGGGGGHNNFFKTISVRDIIFNPINISHLEVNN